MRLLTFILYIAICLTSVHAQNQQNKWMKYQTPEEVGFSSEKLEKVGELYNRNGADALLIIYKGNVLYSKGDILRRFDCHSIRKSLLSAVYGIYSDKELIDINKPLNKIGIDDIIGLTTNEKSATIEDLLKSKSGIYIPALGESKSMSESRPKRGSHQPGEFFYYNNWDFNALNSIFKKETGIDIVNAFYESIAQPLKMEDFRQFDSRLWLDSKIETIHPKLDIKISARDLARFGLVYCNNGSWNGKEIISKEWISKSLYPYSSFNHSDYSESYGFMWWIENLNDSITIYSARGWGGHILAIVPDRELVIVKRHDTYKSSGGDGWTGKYVREILNSRVFEMRKEPILIPLENKPSLSIDTIFLPKREMIEYKQDVFYKGRIRKIDYIENHLVFDDNFILYPISKVKFYIEDYEMYMYFNLENNMYKFDRIE